ncbi:MAG: outer membrane protein OmpA-like peptidoglycan-associated protein [Verrucomicrobiales bacterium]|jgi:outer membrane protein OmpA-like peptidoglycan-associated protein
MLFLVKRCLRGSLCGEIGVITQFAQQLGKDQALRLMLVGRASRTADLEYNRGLSERRK